jgi:hypothetical protein
MLISNTLEQVEKCSPKKSYRPKTFAHSCKTKKLMFVGSYEPKKFIFIISRRIFYAYHLLDVSWHQIRPLQFLLTNDFKNDIFYNIKYIGTIVQLI